MIWPKLGDRPINIASPGGLIAVACVVEILSMTTLATFPSLIPAFRADWSISNTAAGWIGGIYYVGLMLAVALSTALTDRTNAKTVFLAGLAIGAIGALGFALSASGAWSAGLWRLLQGIGLGATYMPGLKLLNDLLPEQARSRATAIYTASYYLAAGLSYFLALELAHRVGWAWTFGLAALGPVSAFVLAALLIPAAPTLAAPPETRLLDYRPIVRNRAALGFSLLYALHNLELFAFSTWVVPLLVFSRSLQDPAALGVEWHLGTIAALISVIALPASVTGNEVAHRIGRQRVVIGVMILSAALGIVLGAAANAAYWLVVTICFAFSALIAADSATLTAGMVQVAAPRYRGTTMSLYAMIGFTGAFIGPVVFGAALDLAGGDTAPGAWFAAFGAVSLLVLLGPLVVRALIGMEQIYR